MAIIPDRKDWTWVLERPCAQCGFDAGSFAPQQVAERIRANAALWPAVLAGPDAARRPAEDTWSALEYAAHVRDVLRLFRSRLAMMLDQDDPVFPSWDGDAVAVAERYGEQDPSVVGGELQAAAAEYATALDAVSSGSWGRPGRRGDGMAFTVASLATYSAHDPMHHARDVGLPGQVSG